MRVITTAAFVLILALTTACGSSSHGTTNAVPTGSFAVNGAQGTYSGSTVTVANAGGGQYNVTVAPPGGAAFGATLPLTVDTVTNDGGHTLFLTSPGDAGGFGVKIDGHMYVLASNG